MSERGRGRLWGGTSRHTYLLGSQTVPTDNSDASRTQKGPKEG